MLVTNWLTNLARSACAGIKGVMVVRELVFAATVNMMCLPLPKRSAAVDIVMLPGLLSHWKLYKGG
jgi:hypothetical protein